LVCSECVSGENTLQCAIIKTHGKHMCWPCVENNTHGKVFFKKITFGLLGMRKGRKYFAVRYNKNTCRASKIIRTAKYF
jgi:hypothetical protein